MKIKTGFTIIELIMVMATIAILAAILTINVAHYIEKTKIAKANTDAKNIGNALQLFFMQYGDYPGTEGCDVGSGQACVSFSNSTGDPCVGGTSHCLSEFYKSDYTANYFVQNAYYSVQLWDEDNDGKIGCGKLDLKGFSSSPHPMTQVTYGTKFIVCQDCPNCGSAPWSDMPFNFNPQ